MKWLVDCDDLTAIDSVAASEDLYEPRLLIKDIDSPNVPVLDNGEPLVEISGLLRTLWVYSWLQFEHRAPALLLRRGLADRLLMANAALPDDFELVILDGWRPRRFQHELYSYYLASLDRDMTGFVAEPFPDSGSVPPHVTGGAVDLTLCWRGAPLGLGSDFDEFRKAAALEASSMGLISSRAGRLRGVLGRVLTDVGLVPYSLEWWHWSYGDQLWARSKGQGYAIYGERGLAEP